MTLVFAAAGLIWFGLAVFGVGRGVRLGLVAALFVAVLMLQLLLPEGHALRVATGGRPEYWAVVLGIGALVALYARGLSWLRSRAAGGDAETPEPIAGGPLSAGALRRYSRQIMLREIGGPGQVKLAQAQVLVVGAGGLGAPVLMYLAAAGVGRITIIDDDVVELSNLQRQIIHSQDRVGMAKVESAKAAIAALNSEVVVETRNARFSDEQADWVAGFDLVIDGCDNYTTRAAVNRACVTAGVPLLSGALSQWEGQVSLFDPARGGPCYACVFPNAPAPGLAPSCAEAGVLGPLPGVIGSILAAEAVKHVTDAGDTLRGRMLIYDALYAQSRQVRIAPAAGCAVCGGKGT